MPRSAKLVVALWSLFMIFGSVQFFYWEVLDDNPPVEYEYIRVPAELAVDSNGTLQLPVELRFCKFTEHPGDLRFRLTSNGDTSSLFPTDLPVLNLGPGCYQRVVHLDFHHVQKGFSYILEGSATYHVNPLVDRVVAFESEGAVYVMED